MYLRKLTTTAALVTVGIALALAALATPMNMAQAHFAEDGRMTGGGVVRTDDHDVTHGFELHCNPNNDPNNLEVNWDGGNNFHMEDLISANCSDNPAIGPAPPNAGFDTYAGTGTGRYNGVSGATAHWIFTDAGEPGTKDQIVILTIWDSDGNEVLSISGNLDGGNHQAHKGN